ncbi:hypothetical protein WICPIJ_006647 [Wickerhamomyces pijperi]|uniref:Uncharacterized protein n=1 Tax=Wickerhamomyces pijperi TaxID=599730 RepID=A0A9P8TK15_WICPI|nr:hypothetical protein WICPIJ_006647 [Wickerhamomyces pijperi]
MVDFNGNSSFVNLIKSTFSPKFLENSIERLLNSFWISLILSLVSSGRFKPSLLYSWSIFSRYFLVSWFNSLLSRLSKYNLLKTLNTSTLRPDSIPNSLIFWSAFKEASLSFGSEETCCKNVNWLDKPLFLFENSTNGWNTLSMVAVSNLAAIESSNSLASLRYWSVLDKISSLVKSQLGGACGGVNLDMYLEVNVDEFLN